MNKSSLPNRASSVDLQSGLSDTQAALHALWHAFTQNWVWCTTNLARQYQVEIASYLCNECGYATLRTSYSTILGQLISGGKRPSKLAELLGKSKQQFSQVLKEIEKRKLVTQTKDPYDKRAKLIVLTPAGHQLIKDSLTIVSSISVRYRRILGKRSLNALNRFLSALSEAEGASETKAPRLATDALFNGLDLGFLADVLETQFIRELQKTGYPSLKPSHLQVINHIGISGSQISELAELHQMTPQALGFISRELENLGYVQRRFSPSDARKKYLYLTQAGVKLIEDATRVANHLEEQHRKNLPENAFNAGFTALLKLSNEEIFTPSSPASSANSNTFFSAQWTDENRLLSTFLLWAVHQVEQGRSSPAESISLAAEYLSTLQNTAIPEQTLEGAISEVLSPDEIVAMKKIITRFSAIHS